MIHPAGKILIHHRHTAYPVCPLNIPFHIINHILYIARGCNDKKLACFLVVLIYFYKVYSYKYSEEKHQKYVKYNCTDVNTS